MSTGLHVRKERAVKMLFTATVWVFLVYLTVRVSPYILPEPSDFDECWTASFWSRRCLLRPISAITYASSLHRHSWYLHHKWCLNFFGCFFGALLEVNYSTILRKNFAELQYLAFCSFVFRCLNLAIGFIVHKGASPKSVVKKSVTDLQSLDWFLMGLTNVLQNDSSEPRTRRACSTMGYMRVRILSGEPSTAHCNSCWRI